MSDRHYVTSYTHTRSIFVGTGQSIDCVALLTESQFVSGSESGLLSLWDSQKKKPLATVRNAHGADKWITSVGAVPYGDVCASGVSKTVQSERVANISCAPIHFSGSNDGTIRLWKCDPNKRKITAITTVPIVGFITAIIFEPAGQHFVAAVAQEHRLGRWSREQKARNGFVLVPLLPS